MVFTIRVATEADLPAMKQVMAAAIEELQRDVLTPEQIESSKAIMGLDTQLVRDGTYFVVESDGEVAGCGGWSRRATLYGHDDSRGRNPRLLDPATDAARVRAMYTAPAYARQGVGSLILEECERAARAEGFSRLELSGTRSGEPLYARHGFVVTERMTDDSGGAPVPIAMMTKTIA